MEFVNVWARIALFVNANTTCTAVHCPVCIDFTILWAVPRKISEKDAT